MVLTQQAPVEDLVWARSWLCLIEIKRAVLRDIDAGLTPEQVAVRHTHWTPFMVAQLAGRGRGQAETVSPREVIARRALGQITTVQMLNDLASREYTFGREFDDSDDYEPGTWDQVRGAYQDGHLSRAEFDLVRRAVGVEW